MLEIRARLLAALCDTGNTAHPLPATIVVAAHPDDEVIGLGSRLAQLKQSLFLHVTDGAPRDGRDAAVNSFSVEQYAHARRTELEAALALCGIAPEQARCLGCPDQQAALRMAELALNLADAFADARAEVVITHPYEGGHPDHDATAFAVHAAVELLIRRGANAPGLSHAVCLPSPGTPGEGRVRVFSRDSDEKFPSPEPSSAVPGEGARNSNSIPPAPAPAIIEMTSYHNGPTGIVSGEFLPCADCPVCTVVLNDEQRAFKRRLFECFTSQRRTLQWFPIGVERFRCAPTYDFTAPPHEGKLYYECFDWGMTGERFRKLAAEAIAKLKWESAR